MYTFTCIIYTYIQSQSKDWR